MDVTTQDPSAQSTETFWLPTAVILGTVLTLLLPALLAPDADWRFAFSNAAQAVMIGLSIWFLSGRHFVGRYGGEAFRWVMAFGGPVTATGVGLLFAQWILSLLQTSPVPLPRQIEEPSVIPLFFLPFAYYCASLFTYSAEQDRP